MTVHRVRSQILLVGFPAGMVNVALWALRVGWVLDAEATSANMPVAIRATPTTTSNLAACLKRRPRPSGRTLATPLFFIRPLPVGSYTLYEHNSMPTEPQHWCMPLTHCQSRAERSLTVELVNHDDAREGLVS